MVFCPNCGHPQKVTFAFHHIQATAKCKHCGKTSSYDLEPSGNDRWVVKR
jgi:ribosomal protein S27E